MKIMVHAMKKMRVAAVSVLAAFACAGNAWAAWNITTWDGLKKFLAEGRSVILTKDLQQPDSDSLVVIKDAGLNPVLDLNGYTLTGVTGSRMFHFDSAGGNLTLKDSSKDKKGALQGPSKAWTGTAGDFGSCFRIQAGTVTMNDITIKGWNKTNKGGHGGAIWIESPDAKFVMNSGVIEDCSATGENAVGGAIFMGGSDDDQSSELEINGGIISNCSARAAGGAIYARPTKSDETSYRPKLTIKGGAFYGNKRGAVKNDFAYDDDGKVDFKLYGYACDGADTRWTPVDGYEFKTIGSYRVVAKKGTVQTISGANLLRAGTFTFDPLDYVSVIPIADIDGCTVTEDASVSPTLYTLSAKSFTVTLNKNGGTCTDLTSYTYGTGATLPTDAAKTGHTFGGWYTNSAFKGTVWTKISTTTTGNKNFYAKWTLNTYTVTLEKNGGTCMDLTSYTYGVGATLPTDAAKTDLTFGGWYTNETFAGEVWAVIGTTDLGNKTFWAKWMSEAKTVKDDDNQDVSVKVSEEWMTEYDVTQDEIDKEGANRLPKWQSYVLGLDPNDETAQVVVVPVQTSDPAHLTLSLGDFAPKADAGVTVGYQLGTKTDAGGSFAYGDEQATYRFEVELPESGVKYYSIRARFHGKGNE